MKHELLEEVWRVRDGISAECGHDLTRLAALVQREGGRPQRPAMPVPAKASGHTKATTQSWAVNQTLSSRRAKSSLAAGAN